MPRAQARREMALCLGVVVGVVLVAFTPQVWLDFVAQLDWLSTCALVIVGLAVLVGVRRRGRAGWAVARGTLIGMGVGLAIVVVFLGVCVATQCM